MLPHNVQCCQLRISLDRGERLRQCASMPTLQPMKITSVDEPWSTCTLIDGTVIRTKTVFCDVALIIDDNGNVALDANGQASFAIENHQVTRIRVAPTTGAKQ